MDKKRCTKCGSWKRRTEFYAAKGTRDGVRGDCKDCFAARAREWYSRNREHVIARVKRWQQENPERVNASNRIRRAMYPERERDGHLRRTFGLSLEAYEELLRAQCGRCRVCGRLPRTGSSLHVDHDHETGEVRGLLCFRCNGGLGQFGEDAERLALAVDYLAGDLEQSSTRALLHGITVGRARLLVGASG